MRLSVEADLARLRMVCAETETVTKDLHIQMSGLKEEIIYLKKQHEEVRTPLVLLSDQTDLSLCVTSHKAILLMSLSYARDMFCVISLPVPLVTGDAQGSRPTERRGECAGRLWSSCEPRH